MKILSALSMLLLSCSCIAADANVDCGKQFENLMRSAESSGDGDAKLALNQLLGRLSARCVALRKCEHIDEILAGQETMLDDEFFKLQKEKLALLREFISRNRENLLNNDLCAAVSTSGPAFEKIQAAHRAEIERINALLQQRISALMQILGPEENRKE